MISLIFWVAFHGTPAEAEALRETAPQYLTAESAADNLYAAREAAAFTNTDPAILLSIAWHESNYKPRMVTREPRHRVSCGVMTPEPQPRCSEEELTLEGGYMAGAAHYRMWLTACHGSSWCADIAYAGGMVSARMCAHDKDVRAPSGHSVCDIPSVFEHRANIIRDALNPKRRVKTERRPSS